MTLVPNETEQALNRQYDVYAAAREEYRKKIEELAAENEKLRAALERARTVLGNMALENAGRTTFWRWPIHHEPLRADARNLLPIIDAALEGPRDRMAKPLEEK